MTRAGRGWARHGLRVGLWAAAAAAAFTSCSGDREGAPQERDTQLKQGAVARVGDEHIDAETVARIAAAQGIGLVEARSKAIHDALMAEHARQTGLGSDPRVLVEQRGVLAEAMLSLLRKQAGKEPSSAGEIEAVTRDHWLDLDRPEARRSVHAVVLVKEEDGPQKIRAAQEVAQRIASAVKGIAATDAFIEAARGQATDGFEVRSEKVGPVTRDGRVADLAYRPGPGQEPQRLDKGYVEAVWKLAAVGEQIGPARSSFGWHVLMLTELQPPQQVAAVQLATMLREEIVARRAKLAMDRELQAIGQRVPVRVERNAVELTEAVQRRGAAE